MADLPKNSMRRRLIFCAVMLTFVGFGMVTLQLYNIQFVNGEMYQQRALSQQLRTTQISANRGSILDRNGNILAVSERVWNVLFSPAEISDAEAEVLAQGMSEILDVDPADIIEAAKDKKNQYHIVKKRVDKETADEVLAFASEHKIKGVNLEENTKRTYPYGSLASSMLGFVNDENKGAYGMEAYFNSTLSGTPGRVVTATNAHGTDMPFRYQDEYKPQDGNSVVTTIDATVQQIVEKHLRTAVIEHGVKNRAAAVFMDITTGEVLAMATMPDFDPNNYNYIADDKKRAEVEAYKGTDQYGAMKQQAQFEQWNNKVISEPYEPGSVFKIVTLAAGLETGSITPEDTYYCPGYHMVGKVRKNCHKLGGHFDQTLEKAVQNSCNPAFMMIGSATGAYNMYHYFESFGLTKPTGIPLPGEANGVYHSEKALANPADFENSLTSVSFGQTFKITPLQMINAVAAACNGGYLYEPSLIKQVVDSKGNIVEQNEPVLQRQVISEETSATVNGMLEAVVSDGSGRFAYIPGYRIGGKTGTSEKIDKEDQTGIKDHILSFVGIAPMDDPKYACLVLLDEPSISNAFGSTIAAPVVGAIMGEALPYLGVEKVFTEEEKALEDISMGSHVGKDPHAACSSVAKSYLTGRIVGNGPLVVAQSPPQGTKVPRGSTIIFYTEEDLMSETVTVPEVRGQTAMAANKLIINSGLNIKVSGVDETNQHAVAASQDIAPGTQVAKGTVITVNFTQMTPNIEE